MTEKTLRDRRIRGLPIDKPKTFIEKYPEFKGQESVCEYPNQPNERRLYTEEDMKDILDKHFKRIKEICVVDGCVKKSECFGCFKCQKHHDKELR